MRVIIDTSSLLSLVRYYLPFDINKNLFEFIENQIKNGHIIVIDAVYKECEYFANGMIFKKLQYLKEKKKEYKVSVLTDTLYSF